MEIISYLWEKSNGFGDFSVEQSPNEGRHQFFLEYLSEEENYNCSYHH